VDALFQMMMKDAAKCTVHFDLQKSVKVLGAEYCLCSWGLPFESIYFSVQVACISECVFNMIFMHQV